jgi:hypothetical protein
VCLAFTPPLASNWGAKRRNASLLGRIDFNSADANAIHRLLSGLGAMCVGEFHRIQANARVRWRGFCIADGQTDCVSYAWSG